MNLSFFCVILFGLFFTGYSAGSSSNSEYKSADWIDTSSHIGVVIGVCVGLFLVLFGWIYFLYSINNKPSAPRDDQWYVEHTRKLTTGNETLAAQMHVIRHEIADLDNEHNH